MNSRHAERWMMMVSDDLREAKRELGRRSDADGAFLRARIEEDEAILNWLGRNRRAGGAHDQVSDPGYSTGNPAQAV
jgi:hypothetical protein